MVAQSTHVQCRKEPHCCLSLRALSLSWSLLLCRSLSMSRVRSVSLSRSLQRQGAA
jgi:hypothetical protein